MINTHNLPMYNLRKAAAATQDWPRNSDGRTQIAYDMETGEVITTDHVGESWSKWDLPVITVCYTTRHLSQQQIADKIAEAVSFARA